MPDDTLHLFVDEAGDSTLFQGKSGKLIVDTPGCSRFFMLGKLEVDDPAKLDADLTALRQEMLADPYFAGVESFRPDKQKTAHLFHAKNDLPEVRYRVFNLLRAAGRSLRFHAVIRDKMALAKEEIAKREASPAYRYDLNAPYDDLAQSLFSKFHGIADHYHLSIAKRGQRDRNSALLAALERAENDFEQSYGFRRGGKLKLTVSDPTKTVCLQAVDYFLWAIQRFYELRRHPQTGEELPREERYLQLLWPQIAELHDLDFGPALGTFFTPQNPLTIEARFPPPKPRKKKVP